MESRRIKSMQYRMAIIGLIMAALILLSNLLSILERFIKYLSENLRRGRGRKPPLRPMYYYIHALHNSQDRMFWEIFHGVVDVLEAAVILWLVWCRFQDVKNKEGH